MNNKKLNILAVDIGFGSVKCAYTNPISGEMELQKFISSVAKLEERPDDFDGESVFQLQENYYALGSAALKQPKSYLMSLRDYEDLKVVTPIWINYLLGIYGKEGILFDKVIIGLSLVYKDKAEDLLDYVSQILMADRSRFVCLPQGVAAKRVLQDFGLSLDAANRTGFKYDNYLLADCGSNTIDVSLVVDGVSSTATSVGLEDMGVRRINYEIIDWIYKNYDVSIDLQQSKTVLDTGQFRYKGRVYDLSGPIHGFLIDYFRGIIDMFDTNPKLSEFISSVQKIILIGGGAELLRTIKTEIDDIIVEKGYPVSFWALPEKNAEYFNAIAYLLIGNKVFSV